MSTLLNQVADAAGRLDVYAAGQHIGWLERSQRGSVFAYAPVARPSDFVSLLMPVRLESYATPNMLNPVFQQNLPEGFLRRKLTERYGKLLATDDYMLLALTGSDAIGRVRVVPGDFAPNWREVVSTDIQALLQAPASEQLFADVLAQSLAMGVSGAMPKVMVQGTHAGEPSPPIRATVHTDGWILKTGEIGHPSLAVNEFFSMRVAQLAGFETPHTALSEDGAVLAVRRFDVRPDGSFLGFEDFCALLALPPERKYSGTLERVFKAIDAFTTGPRRLQARRVMVGGQLLAMAIGNTDAHLKNYGLLYSGIEDVRIAPTFDVVCTRAYPQYANDIGSISVGGKKLVEPDKTFARFVRDRAGMTTQDLQEVGLRIRTALGEVRGELSHYAHEHPAHRSVCLAMIDQFEAGQQMLGRTLGGA